MAEGEAAETPSTALVAVSPPSTLVAEDPAIEAAIKLLESRGIVAGRAAGDGRGGRRLQRTEDGQVVPKAESVAQSMLQRPAPSDLCALRTRLAVC